MKRLLIIPVLAALLQACTDAPGTPPQAVYYNAPGNQVIDPSVIAVTNPGGPIAVSQATVIEVLGRPCNPGEVPVPSYVGAQTNKYGQRLCQAINVQVAPPNYATRVIVDGLDNTVQFTGYSVVSHIQLGGIGNIVSMPFGGQVTLLEVFGGVESLGSPKFIAEPRISIDTLLLTGNNNLIDLRDRIAPVDNSQAAIGRLEITGERNTVYLGNNFSSQTAVIVSGTNNTICFPPSWSINEINRVSSAIPGNVLTNCS